MQPPHPKRRDFITTAAFAMAGAGAVLSLWPFIAALGPAADTRAQRVIFNLNEVKHAKQSLWDIGNKPMLVFLRTPSDLAGLHNSALQNGTRDINSPTGEAYRDRYSEKSVQPEWAKNWHRSLKPEIMICEGRCTHDGCVMRREQFSNELRCPCCGSRYDLAGRAFTGPAPANLKVPNYRYINETEIEFTDAVMQ